MSVTVVDYYKTLELEKSADADAIRQAYRHLALKHHPDKSNDADAPHQFRALAEAYHVLSDLKKRAIYDQYGTQGLKNGVPSRQGFEGYEGGYEFHGDSQLVFEQFFGGNNPFADFFGVQGEKLTFGKQFGGLQGMNAPNAIHQSARPTDPIIQNIPVTLEELYEATIKKIKVSRKVMNSKDLTTNAVDKIFTLEIHKGWKDGTTLTFPAQGNQGPHQLPGDIVFVIQQSQHERFSRQGDDLIFTTKIPLVDALVGTLVDVKTLDGRLLKIPINDTINSNYVKTVPGEGMPLSKDPNQRGNLIIKFETEYPKYLNNEQKELLKKAFIH